MTRGLRLLLVGSALLLAPLAASADDAEDKDFVRRFAELQKKQKTKVFAVAMSPKDDPKVLPDGQAPTGPVLVSGGRMGIYTPPILTPGDIQSVVSQHMVDVRTCYKKQLEKDPEWSDDMILDLAVKKTGRVFEVNVAPGRVRRAVIGRCLMSAVPSWKFPEFTGETDDGITQEVVNASFPFSFSVQNR